MNKPAQQPKLPITICIITHRSDWRFINCLKSSQIAKDVLIYDSASGADWKSLKKKYNFRIKNVQHPINDFSKIRNLSIQDADHEWILHVDSDEEIGQDSYQKLTKILDAKNTQAYLVNRQDVFMGKKLEFAEGYISLPRLIKKGSTFFYRPVHETINNLSKAKASQLLIAHYAHLSIAEFFEKINYYSSLEANSRKSGQLVNLFQLFFYPPLKFFYNYLLKGGFFDGWHGLIYAWMMSLHSLLVRIYKYEKFNSNKLV